MRDIRVIQVGQLLKKHSQAYTLYDADGLCPTLSSGQKGMADYQLGLLYMIPKVLQIGNIVDDTNIGFKNPQRGRVYSIEGIAPAVYCYGGG